MALKIAGANLCLNGGLLNRALEIGLFSADPPDNGASEELSGGAYARQTSGPTALSKWTQAAATGIHTNSGAWNFPVPTAAWADPTHAGLFTVANPKPFLFSQGLAVDVAAPAIGSPVGYAAGALSVAIVTSTGALTPEGLKVCLRSGLVSAGRFFALFSADPGVSRTNELNGNSYAAAAVAATDWDNGADASIRAINTAISFPTPTGAWLIPRWLGLVSAAMGGNLLWKRQFATVPAAPAAGATVRLDSGQVVISFTTDD